MSISQDTSLESDKSSYTIERSEIESDEEQGFLPNVIKSYLGLNGGQSVSEET